MDIILLLPVVNINNKNFTRFLRSIHQAKRSFKYNMSIIKMLNLFSKNNLNIREMSLAVCSLIMRLLWTNMFQKFHRNSRCNPLTRILNMLLKKLKKLIVAQPFKSKEKILLLLANRKSQTQTVSNSAARLLCNRKIMKI